MKKEFNEKAAQFGSNDSLYSSMAQISGLLKSSTDKDKNRELIQSNPTSHPIITMVASTGCPKNGPFLKLV